MCRKKKKKKKRLCDHVKEIQVENGVLKKKVMINCLRLDLYHHPFPPPLRNCNRHMHHCPHSLMMSFPMILNLLLKLLWFPPAPVVVTNLSMRATLEMCSRRLKLGMIPGDLGEVSSFSPDDLVKDELSFQLELLAILSTKSTKNGSWIKVFRVGN